MLVNSSRVLWSAIYFVQYLGITQTINHDERDIVDNTCFICENIITDHSHLYHTSNAIGVKGWDRFSCTAYKISCHHQATKAKFATTTTYTLHLTAM